MDDDTKVYIQILMHEYNTLRAELITKGTAVTQAATVAIATSAGIVTAVVGLKANLWLCALALLPPAVTTFFVIQCIEKPTKIIAARVRQIEKTVNNLARRQLLIHETENGWGGFFDRRKSERRELHRLHR